MSGKSDIKALVIRGDFTEAEFGEVVALIRRLDDARPDAQFEIVAVDPTSSGLEIADRVMKQALPPRADRKTEWAVISRFPGAELRAKEDPMAKANTYYCSFCGKAQNEVKQLIAGPSVFICDECVDLCTEIVTKQRALHAQAQSDIVDALRRKPDDAEVRPVAANADDPKGA